MNPRFLFATPDPLEPSAKMLQTRGLIFFFPSPFEAPHALSQQQHRSQRSTGRHNPQATRQPFRSRVCSTPITGRGREPALPTCISKRRSANREREKSKGKLLLLLYCEGRMLRSVVSGSLRIAAAASNSATTTTGGARLLPRHPDAASTARRLACVQASVVNSKSTNNAAVGGATTLDPRAESSLLRRQRRPSVVSTTSWTGGLRGMSTASAPDEEEVWQVWVRRGGTYIYMASSNCCEKAVLLGCGMWGVVRACWTPCMCDRSLLLCVYDMVHLIEHVI